MELTNVTPETLRASGLKKWVTFPDSLGMWVAESDFGVAAPIKTAIQDAVDRNLFGYIPLDLAAEARAACAEWYHSAYGFEVATSRVRLVGDVLTALRVTLEHFSAPGSRVVIPTPAYMPFSPLAASLGHEVVQVPLLIDGGAWRFDLDRIESALAERPGATLILCNPHNPTGRVYSKAELHSIAEVVERAGARVFVDEIHAPITFGNARHTPYASISAETARHSVTSTSASKAWNMPGLKCAQIIFGNDRDLATWRDSGFWESDSTGVLGVVANIAAYRSGAAWLADFNELVDSNFALVERLLGELAPRAHFARPQGTYLGWIDLREYDLPRDLEKFLRSQAQVAIIQGQRCGDGWAGFIRLNAATTPAIVEDAIRRIAAALPSAA